jgi:alpha-mannosidase
MLINPQTLQKIEKIENRYRALRFEKLLELDAVCYDTKEHFRTTPANVNWKPIVRGQRWGGDWLTRWFKTSFAMPDAVTGRKIFICAKTGALETLAIVDGEFKGVLGSGDPENCPCKHNVVCMTMKAVKGKRHELAFESYSGHSFPGNHPDADPKVLTESSSVYEGIDIVTERDDVRDFIFDLMTIRQTMEALHEDSLRKHEIAKLLERVFASIVEIPSETDEKTWRASMHKAQAIMAPLLYSNRNKSSSQLPRMGLIGHSHLDTAWLWTVDETARKCARTFSSVLNLMEQYPEMLFLQSAPYHAEITRKEYPSIFKKIKARVVEGRWEPNGAMWIEPDCNVPSGEAFVRQLLIGQLATREMFGYTSDTLWLPDVFGYSGSLPQILSKAGVKYFCTTKLAWGEVKFPYDSFTWEGIDGTRMLAHLHKIHFFPDPRTISALWRSVQHKDAQDSLLCPFGFGDGGGGPHAEMLEEARRIKNVEELFTAEYTTVTDFMDKLAEDKEQMPVWSGELYLSAHRGTLTSIAKTKRLNRKLEFALRDVELFSVLATLKGIKYPKIKIDDLWKTLLLNQFHDILPGSSIAEVNDRAENDLSGALTRAEDLIALAQKAIAEKNSAEYLSIFNTLGWERKGTILTDMDKGVNVENAIIQPFSDIDNESKTFIGGISLPPFGATSLKLCKRRQNVQTKSPFLFSVRKIDTPHLYMSFDGKSRIVSCVDKKSGRELVRKGGAFNRILVANDVPAAWDNWDINEDHLLKEREELNFVKREVVSNGHLALCVRSEFKIGLASRLWQDMILYADSPRIDFVTKVDWHEKHMLLKAGFDIDLLSDTARYEIQYGHLQRPRHENLKEDRAKFEVSVHKWMDVSENNFGVALLNDCKYGAYAGHGRMTLTLMKSGTHPDPRGDEGVHYFSYSILTHAAFSAEIIHAAYELNSPVRLLAGKAVDCMPLLYLDKKNVIVESVKWAERENAFVVRLYEAERTGTFVKLSFGTPLKSIAETDLLEENPVEMSLENGTLSFYLKPFEIKTFICRVL